MKFEECVRHVSTMTELKRVANEYVIDYKRLSQEELEEAMIKTAPQYYNENNVSKVIGELSLDRSRTTRILYEIMLKRILLNKDSFMETQKKLEDEVLAYEQKIVNDANEFDANSCSEFEKLFIYVLEAAWEHNNDISVDEQNLINKIQLRFGISTERVQIFESKWGKFPQPGNLLHTREDINNIRKMLQFKGILLPVRDANGFDYDIIPEEVALQLRKLFHTDIRGFAYRQLINSKFVKKKAYLLEALSKSGLEMSSTCTISQLQDAVLTRLTATELLGGFSPKDGLSTEILSAWCSSLKLSGYGSKAEIIKRIIEYYDSIREITAVDEEDERKALVHFYHELASRDLKTLRQQNIIDKDLECEHKFEQATNYIFEVMLRNKPLMLKGTEHPDGILSFQDKLIMWDNKSKETPVKLADHMKQFDHYITMSEKPVSVFLVIAPDFTPDSAKECTRYSLTQDTLVLLITASELKELAEEWQGKHSDDEEVFPLGFFRQSGRFDASMISI